MSQTPAPSDWAASRGEKWRANLAGMEAMMEPLNEPLAHALQLNAPGRIADIGCGGGGTTLDLSRRAPTGSLVHGFDISPALIELARTRLQSDQPNVAFEVADMANTPPPMELYHRLASRFGIMFFDDPPAAFANLARWLKPGGRFAFAAWGHPAENPWIGNVGKVVAQVVDLPPLDPEAPGPFRYASPDTLLALLESAGFSDLEVIDWRGPLAIGGGLPPPEAAAFALAAFSSFAELLAEAGQKVSQEAHQSLTAHFSEHQHHGLVQLDASVGIFTGVAR